jgi:hypothetical protein
MDRTIIHNTSDNKLKLSLSMPRRFAGAVAVQLNNTFLTSAPDAGEWLTSCLSHFTPSKELWYPFNRKTVWVPEPVWTF